MTTAIKNERVTVAFADGSVESVRSQFAAEIIGKTAEGIIVVGESWGTYGLTPCCGVSTTGTMSGVACRSCYQDSPWECEAPIVSIARA